MQWPDSPSFLFLSYVQLEVNLLNQSLKSNNGQSKSVIADHNLCLTALIKIVTSSKGRVTRVSAFQTLNLSKDH